MKMAFTRAKLVTAASVALAGTVLIANGTRFSDYTPLTGSAGAVPVIAEDMPITLSNPAFEQRSIASRQEQIAVTSRTPAIGT